MKAQTKKNFNKWFSRPIAYLMMFISLTAMCGADSLMENGKLYILLLGMFTPMWVMYILHKCGLMEWLDKKPDID